MRISTKAQYAVRALVSLSLHGNGRPLALHDIAGVEVHARLHRHEGAVLLHPRLQLDHRRAAHGAFSQVTGRNGFRCSVCCRLG